jgi:glycosyltransferase involved in cell wall biosynthesis
MTRLSAWVPGPPERVERPGGAEERGRQRLRVTFVTSITPGLEEPNGFASRLHALLTGLIEVADVDLFLRRGAESRWPETVRYWQGLDAVTVHAVLVPPRKLARSSIVKWGRRFRHLMFALLPKWSSPRRSRELARHLKEGRADVLCLHLPVMAHLATSAPAGLPVVAMLEEGPEWDLLAPGARTSERDLLAYSERTWLHRLAARPERARARHLYRRTSKRAAVITVISSEEAALLNTAGIDPNRIVVLPHGLDLSYYKPGEAPAVPEFDVSVFGDLRNLGRNLRPALEALRWAAEHHAQLRWAFVGEINDSDADAVRSAGATVTGRVADMRPHYLRTKVVLVPATVGTGVKTTLLQAWAMGTPVVATPHSVRGVRAVHGENLLIGRTTAELVDHCVDLSMSSDRRDHLATKGREAVESEHDVRQIAARFASLVASLSPRPA